MIDPVALASTLVAEPTITPARGAVFDILEDVLLSLGFAVERFIDGAPRDTTSRDSDQPTPDVDSSDSPSAMVENLLAVRVGGPGHIEHIAFAGHLDVVPPGDGWSCDPFVPTIRDGLLYGRGIADMKGAIAAFVAAVSHVAQGHATLSLLITGDEEGPAIHGTQALIQHMEERVLRSDYSWPDYILVGEPTSLVQIGDMIKIGRRGALNLWIDVSGQAGHVAYPHLADNPVPRLITILSEIETWQLDAGTKWFDPSNIEITQLAAGGEAPNVTATSARARISIRFNDQHKGADLVARVRALVQSIDSKATVRAMISGEAFLTKPGIWVDRVRRAIHVQTGLETELSTSGGTSDARFLHRLCPVVELGLSNATIHKKDEAVAVADIYKLSEIYRHIVMNR